MTNYYLFNKLEGLGFTENDTKVYTHLLERGVSIAPSKIAARLNLHRQYVHRSLHKLRSLGLLEEISVGARTHYKALSPRYITSAAKKQLENAEEVVRELEKISALDDEQDFEVYKGTRQVFLFEEQFVHSLPYGETQYIIGGGADSFISFFGERYEEITDVAKEHGLKAKYIGCKEELPWLERAKTANTQFEYRILDALPKTTVQTAIRSNSVTFYSFGKPPLVYIVKSKSVYGDYKKFFDMLWDMAK